jgi:hypothetical protein
VLTQSRGAALLQNYRRSKAGAYQALLARSDHRALSRVRICRSDSGVFLANRVKKFDREDQLRKLNAAGWISFVQVAPFDESVSRSFECCP